MGACSGFSHTGKWGYPVAPKGDVVDTYHGIRVADPYRWLDDPDADLVAGRDQGGPWAGKANRQTDCREGELEIKRMK